MNTNLRREKFESQLQAFHEFNEISETVYTAPNGVEFAEKEKAIEYRKNNSGIKIEKVLRNKETKKIFEVETFIAEWEIL